MDAPRSSSRPRPSSRPTTPLRPSSRSSFREAHGYSGTSSVDNAGYSQPAINSLEPQFAELADSMADLEANFMHLQLMHESLSRFSESFASFLYGLNMNAFCVDFPEVCGRGPSSRRVLTMVRRRFRNRFEERSNWRCRKVLGYLAIKRNCVDTDNAVQSLRANKCDRPMRGNRVFCE